MRTYSELIALNTIEDRFEYLNLHGKVGDRTFGGYRDLNQYLYQTDPRWKKARRDTILRDGGNELGLKGYPIKGPIYVHHMNPISIEDLMNLSPIVFDIEYLVCMSKKLHDGIHYGDSSVLPRPIVERYMNDTSPWKLTH